MHHFGIGRTSFYCLAQRIRDHGQTYITTRSFTTAPFTTTHGIKQGCPLSPALFSILLSGFHCHLVC